MSNIDLQKRIAELELTVQGLVAERDAAIRGLLDENARLTAERDALKARIEEAEKQEPVGYCQLGTKDGKQYVREIPNIVTNEHAFLHGNEFYSSPLYAAAPIPSPDTAELIRKAREEERERIIFAIPGKKFFSCSDEQWMRNLKTGFNTACDEFLESVNATINKDTENAN